MKVFNVPKIYETRTDDLLKAIFFFYYSNFFKKQLFNISSIMKSKS
jgi:hypothetical protein